MAYTKSTTVDAPFDDVIPAVSDALADEGFGILADIDVQTTLKEKIDVEIDQYRILGACNPPLAHEGLSQEPDLGALLPCNVVVYEPADDDAIVVSAVDPQALIGVTENPALDSIATDVAERFDRVLAEVDEEFSGGD